MVKENLESDARILMKDRADAVERDIKVANALIDPCIVAARLRLCAASDDLLE